jgi:hypothetical protein
MRQVSQNIRTIFAADDPVSFYLVKLTTPTAQLLDTTLPFPVNIIGMGTFQPSSLLSVDPPRMSDTVDRAVYKISYSDDTFEKIAMFESGLTGSGIEIYVGYFNNTSATLGDAAPGQILRNKEDLLLAYAGVVDTQSYNVNPSEGKVVAGIECASPVASLGLSRAFRTSPEGMKRFSAVDTSFSQVYVDGSKLPWGKA